MAYTLKRLWWYKPTILNSLIIGWKILDSWNFARFYGESQIHYAASQHSYFSISARMNSCLKDNFERQKNHRIFPDSNLGVFLLSKVILTACLYMFKESTSMKYKTPSSQKPALIWKQTQRLEIVWMQNVLEFVNKTEFIWNVGSLARFFRQIPSITWIQGTS